MYWLLIPKRWPMAIKFYHECEAFTKAVLGQWAKRLKGWMPVVGLFTLLLQVVNMLRIFGWHTEGKNGGIRS
jgi:hypothetical protein